MAEGDDKPAVQEDDNEPTLSVPDYITEDVRDLCENNESPLRRVAEKFQFPLTDEDYKHLTMLGLRFENMGGAVGLSLPQLGINKRAFMFQIKAPTENDDEDIKDEEPGETPTVKAGVEPTFDELEEVDPRADISVRELVRKKDPKYIWPRTLWINPSYTIPRNALLDEDFETCYSLKCENNFVIGPVFRLNRINYRAYDSQGRIYEGQAEGQVARVIQHEIDHLDGKLYIDYVQPDRVMQLPEYVEKVESGHNFELQKGVSPQFEN